MRVRTGSERDQKILESVKDRELCQYRTIVKIIENESKVNDTDSRQVS